MKCPKCGADMYVIDCIDKATDYIRKHVICYVCDKHDIKEVVEERIHE